MVTRRTLLTFATLFAIALGSLGASAGCSPVLAPVYQVSGARLTPYGGRALTTAEVRAVVLRGAASKPWRIEREEPLVVFAAVSARGHTAKVRIDYNAAGYSISYLDSSAGLKYDGHRIHRRYNHWVGLLNDSIQREFELSLRYGPQAAQAEPAAQPVPSFAAPGPDGGPTATEHSAATGIAPADAPAPQTPAPRPALKSD